MVELIHLPNIILRSSQEYMHAEERQEQYSRGVSKYFLPLGLDFPLDLSHITHRLVLLLNILVLDVFLSVDFELLFSLFLVPLLDITSHSVTQDVVLCGHILFERYKNGRSFVLDLRCL